MTPPTSAADPLALPRVSVITATWNRASLLPRCFDSLCQQQPLPFEWIVVDDGSTDDTGAVLSRLQEDAPFAVHCHTQLNAGKHRAVNRAVANASGDLLLILDSDDMLTPHAIAQVVNAWTDIPAHDRSRYAGVVGHSIDHRGQLIGKPFPADSERVPALRLFHSRQVQGDKLFVHRTELLRQFPFPTFPGETFVSEGIVWDQIRATFRYRLLNDALQIVEYQPNGLSAASLASRVGNPTGARAYYRQVAALDISWTHRLRSLVNHQRFASHGGVSRAQACAESPRPALSAVLRPLGLLAARLDRARLRRIARSHA
jgi:glycosyltransferase involved in cell wall biosynthesis